MLDFILGKAIATYVRRHRALVVIALALTAASTVFVIIPAYLLQPFIDEGMKTGADPVTWKIPWIAFEQGSWTSWHRTERVIVENISPNQLLVILTLVAFVSVLCKSVTSYLSGLAAAAFCNRAVRSMRVDLFSKFVSLPLGFYQKKKAGELIARATADLTVMQTRISNVLLGLLEHPLTAAVFLIYLLVVNYKMTLLIFIVGPIVIGLIRLFGRKVKKHARRVQDTTAELTSAYHEIIQCLKVVHGFFRGEREEKRFKELADYLYKRVMQWNRWDLGISPMMDATLFLVLPVVLIAGKLYFNHTLGELISMVYAFSRLYSPIRKLARVNNNLRTLQGATERVFGIMNTVPEIRDRPGARVLPRHSDSLEFRDVSFSYSPHDPVLKNVTFKVRAGEMVAFVGSTGAGKSTLLDLVSRFYDVTEGSITVDGTDIRDVTIESLRRQIGIVNQETILFHDSIANNIGYGSEHPDSDEIARAAAAAHADGFIMEQPDGYDTVVGDRGTLLSGGQRQRIAIARALLVDPSILILDEAASALDAESERLVQKTIENLRGSMTILVVAHRLSTIMKATRIYVLERGEIVESGTLDELLSLQGRFRQLHDMQYSNGK
jgi:ATP-binding cassette, subfamily B, bacterial MsbA